jgi:uncharacterized protein
VRIVLDTNVVVSALFWIGKPRQILQHVEQGRISLCTSPWLIAELYDVIQRPKLRKQLRRSNTTADETIAAYIRDVETVVQPTQVVKRIAADPDDDHVLACALAAKADYIVSGDRHLRDLKIYQDIPILNAADFLAVYQAASALRDE